MNASDEGILKPFFFSQVAEYNRKMSEAVHSDNVMIHILEFKCCSSSQPGCQ